MAMTGHKSTEMVRRYIKEANIFKNITKQNKILMKSKIKIKDLTIVIVSYKSQDKVLNI